MTYWEKMRIFLWIRLLVPGYNIHTRTTERQNKEMFQLKKKKKQKRKFMQTIYKLTFLLFILKSVFVALIRNKGKVS